MTDNLTLSQMSENQSNKYVTSNDGNAELDAAITAPITKTVTSSNAATVTVAELQRANVIDVQPDGDAPTAEITITIAAVFQRGTFTVVNDTLQYVKVEISGQSDPAPIIPPNGRAVVELDGVSVRPVEGGLNGTAGTGTTAHEWGDGFSRLTRLTIAGVLPDIVGGAAEAEGLLIYTFPAGVILVDAVHMDVSITQTDGFINADTPEVGIGSVIATGAVLVLNGNALFMDYVTEQTATNCTGTKTEKSTESTAGGAKLLEASDAHTVHFNAADTWAASGDAAAIVGGEVWIAWRFLGA